MQNDTTTTTAKGKSLVGVPINFRGLVYAPVNEMGVVYLFGLLSPELGMYIEEVRPQFPDCTARRLTDRGWEHIRIEFEYTATNFLTHGHDPAKADLLVCWENDWPTCPLPIIELRKLVERLPNLVMRRPEQWIVDMVSRPARAGNN